LLRGLLTTRGSAGHVLPRAPFGQACVRAGHEVRVVAQRQNRLNVERTALAVSLFDDPASASTPRASIASPATRRPPSPRR
jgi:UDP:flavonoid glycosyltransferase YjiC (YdhE family)